MTRSWARSVLLGILLLGSGSLLASGVDKNPSAFSHQIQAIIDSVSVGSIRSSLDTLVSFTYRHTVDDTTSTTTGIGAARRWVYRRFQEISAASGGRLQPQYFDFTATICGVTRLHRNIMAVLPGTLTPNRYYVVSGHLDTRGDPNNACLFGIFSPGANDDGSGTAVSIELARVLSRYQFDASLIFMAVVGEDEGLFGSEAYAAYAQANGIRIDGMITNDVVGNITGSNGITDSLSVRHFSSVNDATPHRQMARSVKVKAQTYYPGFTVNLIPDVDRPGRSGDHQSFQNHGFTAVRFTEPNENLAYQHTPQDIVANLSPAYIARITRVNALTLASLAWAPEKPLPPTLTDPGNGTALQVQWNAVPMVPDFGGYRLAVRDSGGLFYTQIHTAGNVTQFTITNLTPGIAVYVSVAAYDTAGNESMFSNETLGRPTVVPTAPANFSSTSVPTTAVLTWSPNSQLDVVKYRISRSTSRTSGFARYDSVAHPTTVYSDPAMLLHTLYFYQVCAVDNQGNESTPSNTVAGQRVTHDLGILVVDGTRNGNGASPLSPTDSVVDAYYQALLSDFRVTRQWEVIDSVSYGIRISDAEMGPYSTVVWHSEVPSPPAPAPAPPTIYPDTSQIREYLQQGGRLVMAGWRLSSLLRAASVNPYPAGSFVPVFLKVDSTTTSGPFAQDFITATAQLAGYANLPVDSLKVPTYGGTLINTDAVLTPFASGIAQMLFSHHGKNPGSPLEGKPIAWRYLGSDFKVTVMDFPLYYMQQDGARTTLRKALIDMGEQTDVEEEDAQVPDSYVLFQNYPNPFNPWTEIRFGVPVRSRINISIFNVLGQEVRQLTSGEELPGLHFATWDGRGRDGRELSSGVYFLKMVGESVEEPRTTFSDVKKALLMK